MADSAIPDVDTVESVPEAIAALGDLGITVIRTDRPVALDFYRVNKRGDVPATVGRVTVSRTGRVFVELCDMDPHMTKDVLGRLETLVTGDHRNDLGWKLWIYITREYAEQYLAVQVFRDQLNDRPYRCSECHGRMSRARYGRWVHAKCETNTDSIVVHMEVDARKRLFKAVAR